MTEDQAGPVRRRAPAFAPGAAEEELLRFVLTEVGGEAHLHRWRALVSLDDASSASHDLLPSAYLRMESLDAADPDIGRLRGIYRQRWAAGQQHHAAARSVGRALGARAIPHLMPADQVATSMIPEPLFLPLVTPYITVPDERLSTALDALHEADWRVTPDSTPRSVRLRLAQTEWRIESETAPGLRAVLGTAFDPLMGQVAHARAVWDRTTGPVADESERMPAPADLFFALVTAGAREAEALRWAIGSLPVARRDPSIADFEATLLEPGSGFLLDCIASRLAFLATVDPDVETVAAALAIVRREAAGYEGPLGRDRGPLGRQWAHRSRQARVVARAVRRHGGVGRMARHVLRGG